MTEKQNYMPVDRAEDLEKIGDMTNNVYNLLLCWCFLFFFFLLLTQRLPGKWSFSWLCEEKRMLNHLLIQVQILACYANIQLVTTSDEIKISQACQCCSQHPTFSWSHLPRHIWNKSSGWVTRRKNCKK